MGILAFIMLYLSGVEGIKTLSYLGGFPALFFELGCALALLNLTFNPARYGIAVPPSKRRGIKIRQPQ